MNAVLEQLTPIFHLVFDNDQISLTPETTADQVDGWDSFSHINLIMAIEQHFGITFNYREVASFKNVGDLARLIVQKIGT